MRINTRIVFDMTQDDVPVIECDSYEYEGDLALCGGGGGKSPSIPDAPPPPPKPVQSKDVTETVAAARNDQKNKARRAVGHQGTIMTGGLGLGDKAQTQKKTLGG